jgi:hypothetical protein
MPETIGNISRVIVPYNQLLFILLRLLTSKLLLFPEAQ